MVEQTAEPTTRNEMRDSISARANELIKNMESMKITKSLDNDNLQCRV